jgi:hypothetical protein
MTLSLPQQNVVRREVAEVLQRSAAFRALPAHQRAEIARNTMSIVEAMALSSPAGASADPYALALADPAPPPPGAPPPPERWRPDNAFKSEAINAGVKAAGDTLREVDFPGFVASLVQGTFHAIVSSSIEQMKAYGELVQSVAMSLNDFRDQNVSVAQGRDHLVSKYPNVFKLDVGSGSAEPKVKLKDGANFDGLPDFQRDLGLSEEIDELDDQTIEDQLVPAAQTDLARGRQQLLATMVLMGINRIVVTDGRINAKIRFSFSATDHLERTGTAEAYENQTRSYDFDVSMGRSYAKGHVKSTVPISVATTTGSSTADIQAAGVLSGEVSINFKSDFMPLEKMISTDQIMQLNQAQKGGARGTPPSPPAGPTLAPSAPSAKP